MSQIFRSHLPSNERMARHFCVFYPSIIPFHISNWLSALKICLSNRFELTFLVFFCMSVNVLLPQPLYISTFAMLFCLKWKQKNTVREQL